jgi:predicted metalloprotease
MPSLPAASPSWIRVIVSRFVVTARVFLPNLAGVRFLGSWETNRKDLTLNPISISIQSVELENIQRKMLFRDV